MANIFGVNIETPQETQERLRKERLSQMQLFKGDVNAQLGYGIADAIGSLFGGGVAGQQRGESDERQEALAMGQKVKEAHTREGTDPFDTEIMARATAAAHLRALGGAENIALANQMTDSNTQLMLEKEQRTAEMNRLRATTEASEQQTAESKRRVFESLDISDLRSEQELNAVRLSDGKFLDTPAGEALRARQLKIGDRINEIRTEKYIPMRGIDAEELGVSPDQLQALSTPDGLPVETYDRLVQAQIVKFNQSKLTPKAEAIVDDAWKSRSQARANSRSALAIRSDLQTVARAQGAGLTMQQAIAGIYGADADVTQLQAEINRVLLGEAISRRPPGPLSEKELDILRETTVNPNADANQLIGAFTTTARIAEYNARYESAKIEHLNDNRDLRNFDWDEDGEWNQIVKDIPEVPGAPVIGAPRGEEAAAPQQSPKIVSVKPLGD